MNRKGWFRTSDRDGDRTIDEQMQGLEPLVAEIKGKRVLDFGCAEGLIGMELVKAGAATVSGFDSVVHSIEYGKQLASSEKIDIALQVANLNDYDVSGLAVADVVLMLAILHKLQDPSKFARAAAALCSDLMVVRLPPSGPVIRDQRSMYVAHDILKVLNQAGLTLESKPDTVNGEWLGYFRRTKADSGKAPADAKPLLSAAAPPPAATAPPPRGSAPLSMQTGAALVDGPAAPAPAPTPPAPSPPAPAPAPAPAPRPTAQPVATAPVASDGTKADKSETKQHGNETTATAGETPDSNSGTAGASGAAADKAGDAGTAQVAGKRTEEQTDPAGVTGGEALFPGSDVTPAKSTDGADKAGDSTRKRRTGRAGE